jgi:hypothetical protein
MGRGTLDRGLSLSRSLGSCDALLIYTSLL